jgi:hypothetical protein
MVIEKRTGMNPLSLLGALEYSAVRDGKIRATGPFAHAILAGTVGAACLPMAMYLWRSHRFTALAGIGSCLAIVYASTSSGPVLMLLTVVGGMWLVRWRRLVPAMRVVAIAGVFALQAVMKDPWYFVIARIDITGSSTGWHRSQLIRSWLDHTDEWVLAGTDYTRHWMPTGLRITSDHTDITNHFIQQAVWGGLPLLTVFVLLLWAAFARVGRELRATDADADADELTDVVTLGEEEAPPRHAPVALTWMAGVLLFGHVINFVAISLFDQSSLFFLLVLAMIAAVAPDASPEEATADRGEHFGGERPTQRPPWAAGSLRS